MNPPDEEAELIHRIRRLRSEAATGRFRRRRQRLGISLRKAAAMANTTASTGSRMEAGVTATRPEILIGWDEMLTNLEGGSK